MQFPLIKPQGTVRKCRSPLDISPGPPEQSRGNVWHACLLRTGKECSCSLLAGCRISSAGSPRAGGSKRGILRWLPLHDSRQSGLMWLHGARCELVVSSNHVFVQTSDDVEMNSFVRCLRRPPSHDGGQFPNSKGVAPSPTAHLSPPPLFLLNHDSSESHRSICASFCHAKIATEKSRVRGQREVSA